ncbi:unnamed protein product, partial [marine sediment metagenome]
LEDEGFFENTIVILTADHGEEFWEHNAFGHGHCLYPEVIRIPLMIYLPPSLGCVSGRLDEYVSLVDIAPTILDYLGLPEDKGMGGRSISKLIESCGSDTYDDGGVSDYTVFSEFIQNRFVVEELDIEKKGIYEGNYHLIYDFNSGEKELYALDSDPGEFLDISADDEDTTDRLYSELMEWYETNLQIVEELAPQREMEIEEVARQTPERIKKLSIDPFSGIFDFQARELASFLTDDFQLAGRIANFIKNLYRSFTACDASLAEINPLVVTKDGQVIALDAKINLDDNGLYRHQDYEQLRDKSEEGPSAADARQMGLSYIPLEGNIACVVNGAG